MFKKKNQRGRASSLFCMMGVSDPPMGQSSSATCWGTRGQHLNLGQCSQGPLAPRPRGGQDCLCKFSPANGLM